MTTMDRLAWARSSSTTTTTTDSRHQERMEALKSLNQVVSSRGRRVSAGPQWSFEGEVPNTKAVPTQYSHQQVKRGRWGGGEYANYARIEAHSYVKQGLALSLFTL